MVAERLRQRQRLVADVEQPPRLLVAVAVGVMAVTAVLTGAVVVGESMSGSLRDLVLDRLGRIDSVLVVPRFFREQLAAAARDADCG